MIPERSFEQQFRSYWDIKGHFMDPTVYRIVPSCEVRFYGSVEMVHSGEFTGSIRDIFGESTIEGVMNEHELTWTKMYGSDSSLAAIKRPIKYSFV